MAQDPVALNGIAQGTWSRRKKDQAPRGIRRHPSGMWAIRFTCGAGHLHKEKIGPLKSDAIAAYHARRAKARGEPGWCPQIEAAAARERVRREQAELQAQQAREQARVSFRDYADGYGKWAAAGNKRSWRTDQSRIRVLSLRFGECKLDEITSLDVERFRDSLLDTRTKTTANRYRDLLSAIYKRAIRDGLVATNPVKLVSKFKENNKRVTYLVAEEEAALYEALPAEYRPHFLVSIHTGLRWSEQMGLRWRDVDMLTALITVPRSKNGESRRVPTNSLVRSVLVDLGSRRERPGDPAEPVFAPRPYQAEVFFPKAIQRAIEALEKGGKGAGHLEGYVWHANRHTFASRLAMAGVDLLTIQELGGWKTLSMVQRYAHLAPSHLHAAVERLAGQAGLEVARK